MRKGRQVLTLGVFCISLYKRYIESTDLFLKFFMKNLLYTGIKDQIRVQEGNQPNPEGKVLTGLTHKPERRRYTIGRP